MKNTADRASILYTERRWFRPHYFAHDEMNYHSKD